MKSISSALTTHLAPEVTTLATCWRVTRKDGREFFFTDHDRDLAFDGNVYLASSGYSRSAIANDAGMAVDKFSISLTDEHARLVADAVASGDYASSSEVIREALRDWRSKRLLGRIWDEGIGSGRADAHETIEDFMQAARRRQSAG